MFFLKNFQPVFYWQQNTPKRRKYLIILNLNCFSNPKPFGNLLKNEKQYKTMAQHILIKPMSQV